MYAKQRVYEEFKDIPALIDVAYCESRFRQFQGTSTEPLLGELNSSDIGVMQINRHFNQDEADRKGIDLRTVDGNIAMAKILYHRDGLRPWKSSFSCMNNQVKLRERRQDLPDSIGE